MKTKAQPWPEDIEVYLGRTYRHKRTDKVYNLVAANIRENRIELHDREGWIQTLTGQELQRDWEEIQ